MRSPRGASKDKPKRRAERRRSELHCQEAPSAKAQNVQGLVSHVTADGNPVGRCWVGGRARVLSETPPPPKG